VLGVSKGRFEPDAMDRETAGAGFGREDVNFAYRDSVQRLQGLLFFESLRLQPRPVLMSSRPWVAAWQDGVQRSMREGGQPLAVFRYVAVTA